MTIGPGLILGIGLLAGAAILFISGRSIAARRPGNAWLVSFGRVMFAVAGLALVAWAWFVPARDVSCGAVVSIDQVSLVEVDAFTLREANGTLTTFWIEPGRLSPDSFTPGHLREHLALAAPVCVTHAPGDSLALDLRDAPP